MQELAVNSAETEQNHLLNPRFSVLLVCVFLLAFGGWILSPASHVSWFSTNVFAAHASQPAVQTSPQPVLVELFTSEGCSSCPPADALLAKLDAEQFVPGAEAIVLSEHVNYWNNLGWRDPFSSQAMTERQNDYGIHFGLSSVYTPQAVIDGDQQVVGSDGGGLARAVQSAAAKPKIPLSLDNLHWSGDTVTAEVESGSFPKANQKVTLLAALADDSDSSNVLHGENGGSTLRHVAVVRTLVEIGKTSGPLDKTQIQVRMPAGVPPQSKMRLVVFLTEAHDGRVLGAAMRTVTR